MLLVLLTCMCVLMRQVADFSQFLMWRSKIS